MILARVRRYAAMSTGDFDKIFSGMKLPVLPQAAMKLLEEIRSPEVSMSNIANIISSDPGLSAHVLKIVNSAMYALPNQIGSIVQAANILGTKKIENLAISYAVMESVKNPGRKGFDFDVFWSESLYKGLFARECAVTRHLKGEDAFAGGLLQDIALPVLLTSWFDAYKHVYVIWKETSIRLSSIEHEQLSWTHAQAGAWIAKKWKLPDVLVCSIGLHTVNMSGFNKIDLLPSVPAAVALSALIPVGASLEHTESLQTLLMEAEAFGLGPHELTDIAHSTDALFETMTNCFGISTHKDKCLGNALEEIIE